MIAEVHRDLWNAPGYITAFFDEEESAITLIKHSQGNYTFDLKYYIYVPAKYKNSVLSLKEINSNPNLLNEAFIERILFSEIRSNSQDDEKIEVENNVVDNVSITGRLFKTLSILYQITETKAISLPYYRLFSEVEIASDCPPVEELGYTVIFESSYIALFEEFYVRFSNRLLDLSIHPKIFSDGYHDNSNPLFFKGITIVQSNTKQRRLGYLKFTLELFNDTTYFPSAYLSRTLEKESIKINYKLKEYKELCEGDDKGLITISKTGISAEPYIDLLCQLNMLTEINKSFILTKQVKVYALFNKLIKTDDTLKFKVENTILFDKPVIDNPFVLNHIDCLFLLNQILISDSLYSWSLLELLYVIGKRVTSKKLRNIFQPYVSDELLRIVNSKSEISNKVRRDATEVKKRILSWTRAEIYLEHIVEPRLNWLLDLKLVSINDEKDKAYNLTEYGFRLLDCLTGIYENYQIKHLQLATIFGLHYFEIFSYVYQINVRKKLDIGLIDKYLKEAFIHFKTDAPNRIAASQAINFVCYSCLLKNNTIIEFDELKKFLSVRNLPQYSLDWFQTENDGSLSLNRNNEL